MKTIQYQGSKKQLLEFIDNSIKDYLGNNSIKTFHDAFSGSGRVAYYFADKYQVISSDKQYFSKIILDAYLNSYNVNLQEIDQYISQLNNIDDSYFENTDKWFTFNYSTDYNDGVSVGADGNPKIWITKNAKKIDSIRTEIEKTQDEQIKNILLLSLILAINKISNVVGHQNGYLKKWAKHCLNDLILYNPIKDIDYSKIIKNSNHYVGDIFELLPNISADLIYFDPPYGTNNKAVTGHTRYSSFYHLWNTLVKNDRPKLFGKAGKPIETKGWTPELEQNKKEVVAPLFEKLFELSNSKYVCLSYSNQGLLSKEEVLNAFDKAGCFNIKCYEKQHKINNQTKLAKKDGLFIDRTEDKELIEYFFIATK